MLATKLMRLDSLSQASTALRGLMGVAIDRPISYRDLVQRVRRYRPSQLISARNPASHTGALAGGIGSAATALQACHQVDGQA
jgi:hypothetical protein